MKELLFDKRNRRQRRAANGGTAKLRARFKIVKVPTPTTTSGRAIMNTPPTWSEKGCKH